MVNINAVKLGTKGGKNSRKNLTAAEAKELAQKASRARWDAYYKLHPEKLKAKKERAKKAAKKKVPRDHK